MALICLVHGIMPPLLPEEIKARTPRPVVLPAELPRPGDDDDCVFEAEAEAGPPVRVMPACGCVDLFLEI